MDEERRAVEGGKVLAMERALTRRDCEIALLRSDRLSEEQDHRHAAEQSERMEASLAGASAPVCG